MKVLLISTKAGIRTEWLQEQLRPLGEHTAAVSIVALTRPAEHLPVQRCLVLGKSIRPRRPVGEMPTPGHKGRPVSRTRVDGLLARVVPDRWSSDRSLMALTGGCWSADVRRMFLASDIVVALDANATWLAWELAHRIRGPEVVYGVVGAVRKIEERAARSEG